MLEIALLLIAVSLFVLSWVIHWTTQKKIEARRKYGHVLHMPKRHHSTQERRRA